VIHIRVDGQPLNSQRRFACGIGPELPPGDVYYFEGEADRAGFRDDPVCPGCYLGGRPQIGTPIDKMTGAQYQRICESWGHS
jgi:hypothetical protein